MVVKITDKMKFSRSFDYVDNGIEHGVLSKFEPKEILLKKGTLIAEGFKPLDCDIKMLKDVPVKLRDGVTIYTDIYLPNNCKKFRHLLLGVPMVRVLGLHLAIRISSICLVWEMHGILV